MIPSGLKMASTLLIGITGRARCGKDTFGVMLEEELDKLLPEPDCMTAAFADPLKEMLSEGLGLIDKDPSAEEIYGKNYRAFAQTLGTEWGRELIDPDIWLRVFHQRYSKFSCPIIMTDVRFENEARFIRDRVGVIIHLESPEHEQIAESEHKSEGGIKKHLDARDYIVANNEGLEELAAKAETLASEIFPFIRNGE